jgi:hypothetical protein
VQLFLDNYLLVVFITTCLNGKFNVMRVVGRETECCWVTFNTTNREKPLNASVKLVFVWKIEPAAFVQSLSTHM